MVFKLATDRLGVYPLLQPTLNGILFLRVANINVTHSVMNYLFIIQHFTSSSWSKPSSKIAVKFYIFLFRNHPFSTTLGHSQSSPMIYVLKK